MFLIFFLWTAPVNDNNSTIVHDLKNMYQVHYRPNEIKYLYKDAFEVNHYLSLKTLLFVYLKILDIIDDV